MIKDFTKKTFTKDKLKNFFVTATLGNFIGFLTGTFVTYLLTYSTIERRAVTNLFGVLPRKKIVVHFLPEWLEWTLSIILGFLAMEFVKHLFAEKGHLILNLFKSKDRSKDKV